MTNSEKYHFSDFTHQHYQTLLQEAKLRFSFLEYNDDVVGQKDFILWRHDIDVSMQSALKLAQIEANMGIKSTYFVLLHSYFYNLLENEITDLVRKIIDLGHNIGLHFDAHYYKIDSEERLEKHLVLEKNLLENIFQTPIHVFSFHDPDAFCLNCQRWKYGGMINTYAEFFQNKIAYTSDSNGYWRHRRMFDVITDSKITELQVLTHPEWWQKEVMSPKQKIWYCIDGRADNTKTKCVALLQKYDRLLIDWE